MKAISGRASTNNRIIPAASESALLDPKGIVVDPEIGFGNDQHSDNDLDKTLGDDTNKKKKKRKLKRATTK